jgi:hypothetical protein
MNTVLCSAGIALAIGVSASWAQAQPDANSAKIFKGYALSQLTAAGLLYNAQAKATYHRALGPLVKEPWLARLDGPSREFRPVGTCKNHDCHDNTILLLWSGVQNVVYGKVVQRGKSTLIGSPPPAVAGELEKLWKAEFRSQPK